jgi:TPR repeat protein
MKHQLSMSKRRSENSFFRNGRGDESQHSLFLDLTTAGFQSHLMSVAPFKGGSKTIPRSGIGGDVRRSVLRTLVTGNRVCLSALIGFVLSFSLAGCSPNESAKSDTKPKQTKSTEAQMPTPDKTDPRIQQTRVKAEQGDFDAQLSLGAIYEKGEGLPQDPAEAAKWYRKAAENGLAEAQYKIGFMCEYGQGVTQNFEDAAQWYKKSAEAGNAMAANRLGLLFASGRGVQLDYAQAVSFYRKAADQGNVEAQNNLGAMHDGGMGVTQDFAVAAEWYRKAADQGDAEAQFRLAAKYVNGQGVSQDIEEACRWYHKAAEQGWMDAQFALGVRYGNGQGVTLDVVEACKWLDLAASQKHEYAEKISEFLQQNMTPEQIVESKRRASEFAQKISKRSLGESVPRTP